MGLNRLLSLSKSNVLSDVSKSSDKSSKKSSKTKLEPKETCKSSESSVVETQKIDKTLKNGKSTTTTKKSMLWTLRITNMRKNLLKKGKILLKIYESKQLIIFTTYH